MEPIDVAAAAVTAGVIVAGAALFEVAILPAIAIGGVAVVAPRLAAGLGRALAGRPPERNRRRPPEPRAAPRQAPNGVRGAASLSVRQAALKTVTFRLIVTTLDFGGNYLILGQLGPAAGLSAFSLVAGPVFYFIHEIGWNYLRREGGPWAGQEWLGNSAILKTISYRAVATAPEFTANLVVAGNFADALAMSSIGFFLGPLVYWGHEMLWERATAGRAQDARPTSRFAIPALPPPIMA